MLGDDKCYGTQGKQSRGGQSKVTEQVAHSSLIKKVRIEQRLE